MELEEILQSLIKIYKQEKEKNNELEIELSTRDNINVDKLVEKYKYYRRLANSYQANCISKDKIKEKIENLSISLNDIENSLGMTANKYDTIKELNIKIDVLEELLEEV